MTPRARLSIALAAVIVVASALTGCSSPPPDLQQTTATQLQAGVQTLTAAAAAGDLEAAQASLDAVQADLLAAAAAEKVSAARAAEIQSALNLVSADLAAAVEASQPEPTVAPAPSDEPASVDTDNKKDNGKCKKKDDDCDDGDD